MGMFLGSLESRSIGRNIDRVHVARGKLPMPTKSMVVALRATWWHWSVPKNSGIGHKKNWLYWSIDTHLVAVDFVLVCKDIFLSGG